MSNLLEHPAVSLNFESAPAGTREAFETLRDAIVEAPNKQASYAAVASLSSLFSTIKQAQV